MSHHFIDVLDELRTRLARMTAMVQLAVEQAVEAVFTLDPRIMQQVIDGDTRIDEEEVQVEKSAINLLALYQPAASDLRLITTIIKVNGDFERIADCAVNVAQRVQYLRNQDHYEPPNDLRVMANSVIATLRDTIQAFNLTDENLARRVLRGDDVVDALYHQIVQDMLTLMENQSHKANQDLSNIMIAKNLERMADHCTNIAEDVIYVNSGRIIRHLHAV
ncbi:MAG TPA: phosphate signaling complex protein PhoU [Tepidisphaeraceae bacterium]|nr:phosphate signaling complex protein PhoU [Tepidisphaeraceae bacterium]